MAAIPNRFRRTVVSSEHTGAWFSNYYHAKLTCGHTITSAGRKGKPPAKAACYKCWEDEKRALVGKPTEKTP